MNKKPACTHSVASVQTAVVAAKSKHTSDTMNKKRVVCTLASHTNNTHYTVLAALTSNHNQMGDT